MTSESVTYQPNQQVTLSFDISGNQRNAGTNNYFVNFCIDPSSDFVDGSGYGSFDTLGAFSSFSDICTGGPCASDPTQDGTGGYGKLIGFNFPGTIADNQGFVTDFITFKSANVGTLSFGIGTPDNTVAGPILDNVLISSVPEPTSWALMIVGFGIAGAALRRHSRTTVRYAAA